MSLGLSLLLLLACTDGKSGDTGRAGPAGDDGGSDAGSDDGGSGDGGLPDDDSDGWPADLDCDDDDPTVHPDAVEVCDGIDQDCDLLVDEDVPGDGDGCQDPGMPDFPATVDTVHLALRTGDDTYDGTDDGGISFCIGPTHCLDPYKPDWNDLEPGEIDVTPFEGLGWPRADLDRFTLTATDGSDKWVPAGFQLTLDGEPVYCRQTDFEVGDQPDELLTWTDPDGLSTSCTTIFDSPLTHGPMVGAVGPDRARFWFRTDATRHVQLRVAQDEAALADAAPVHHAYPLAADDFAAEVEIVGLQPDRRYVYSLEVEGQLLGPWELFTAPPAGATTNLRLAFGSCSKQDDQPVFGPVLAWDPDVFLFIGDNHYANSSDLGALRQYYRWAHERPLRRELLAETSILATWDDHDYVGNNTDGTEPGKDTALRVFGEYWANSGAGIDGVPGVFFRQAWGDVELFVLDDRYHRGLDGTLLGQQQQDWLIDALDDSDATFKLVACGSQFTPYGSSDSWAAFDDAWDDLRNALADRSIGGVVLLSGDIHRMELRAPTPASGGATLYEISSSSLAYGSPSTCGDDASEPDRFYCNDDIQGFVGLDIDTTAADPSLTAQVIDEWGTTWHTWTVFRSELD